MPALATNTESSPYARVGAKLTENGYHAIPVLPGKKFPGKYEMGGWREFDGWQQYCNRPPSEIEIEFWSAWPDAGVCVALDHKLKVIDIDTDDAEMVRAVVSVIPSPMVKKRGKKGFSAFYRGSDAIVSKAFRISGASIVDLLAHGRQTVLPPTIHPDTGQAYQWLTPDTLENISIEELPELPDNIAELIADALKAFGYEPPIERTHKEAGGVSYWRDLNDAALSDLDSWVPALGLPKTRRKGKGYRAVATWRPAVNSNAEGNALSIHPNGITDWGGVENHTAIDVVMLARSCELSEATDWLEERLGAEFDRGLPPDDGFNHDRLIAYVMTRKEVAVAANVAVANDNETNAALKDRFNFTLAKDISPSLKKEWLVKGYIGAGEFSLLVGKPGTGKSIILGDVGCHIAAGIDWHGRKVKQGLVVFFAAERRLLTERRINAWKKHHGIDDFPLVVGGGKLDLTSGVKDAQALADGIRRLEDELRQECRFVIIDTLTRTFGGGDQNTSRDMQRYIQSIDTIQRTTTAHASVIHHSGWDSERGKGAIDLDGGADSTYGVKMSGTGKNKSFVLECTGANDGEEGVITGYRLESVALGVDEDGNETTAPVAVPFKVTPADGSNLKSNADKVLDALRAVIDEDGQSPPAGSPGFPDGVVIAPRHAWRNRFLLDAKNKQPNAKEETLDRTFRRGGDELTKAGKVHVIGEWAWVGGQIPDMSGQ